MPEEEKVYSFLSDSTVADEFGIASQNAPTNPAFIEYEALVYLNLTTEALMSF